MQRCILKLFAKIVNDPKPLTISTKISILDVWQSSECAFEISPVLEISHNSPTIFAETNLFQRYKNSFSISHLEKIEAVVRRCLIKKVF